MKSLKEHNQDMWNSFHSFSQEESKKAGVLCPMCNEELWDTAPNMVLASLPPQKNVHCDCGYKGYMIV